MLAKGDPNWISVRLSSYLIILTFDSFPMINSTLLFPTTYQGSLQTWCQEPGFPKRNQPQPSRTARAQNRLMTCRKSILSQEHNDSSFQMGVLQIFGNVADQRKASFHASSFIFYPWVRDHSQWEKAYNPLRLFAMAQSFLREVRSLIENGFNIAAISQPMVANVNIDITYNLWCFKFISLHFKHADGKILVSN